MEGGCSAPVAAHAEVLEYNDLEALEGKNKEEVNCSLQLAAGVWSLDGKTSLKKNNKVEYYNASLRYSKSDADL